MPRLRASMYWEASLGRVAEEHLVGCAQGQQAWDLMELADKSIAKQHRVDAGSRSSYAGRLYLRVGAGLGAPCWEEVVEALVVMRPELAMAAG